MATPKQAIPAARLLVVLRVLFVLTLIMSAAVPARAYTFLPDLALSSVVDCSETRYRHCTQCRIIGDYYFCSLCEDGYSIFLNDTKNAPFAGTCQRYKASTCTLPFCRKCAADDATRCVECEGTGDAVFPVDYTCPDPAAPTTTTTPARPEGTESMDNWPVVVPCEVPNCLSCFVLERTRCYQCNAKFVLTPALKCIPQNSDTASLGPRACCVAVGVALVAVTVAVFAFT